MTENRQKMKTGHLVSSGGKTSHAAYFYFLFLSNTMKTAQVLVSYIETLTSMRTHTHTRFLLCCSVDLPSLSAEDLRKVEHFNQIS